MYHSFKKSQWLSVSKIIVQQNKIHATFIKSCSCSLTCVLTLVTVLGGVTRVGKVCCNPPRAAAAVSAVTRRVIPVILLITVISSARTGIAGPAPPPPNLQPGRARGNSGVRETWTLFLRDQLSSSLLSTYGKLFFDSSCRTQVLRNNARLSDRCQWMVPNFNLSTGMKVLHLQYNNCVCCMKAPRSQFVFFPAWESPRSAADEIR